MEIKKVAEKEIKADGGRRRYDTDGECEADRNKQMWNEIEVRKNRNKRSRKGLVDD